MGIAAAAATRLNTAAVEMVRPDRSL